MKSLSKFAAVATGLTSLMIAAFALSPVMADSPGQIEGGPIYRIKNLTQNVDYANPAQANACDELEYSVRLHNSGYGGLSNIVVSATLPASSSTSNTSNMTITYNGGAISTTTASATVNLTSAQSISYESGSTQLLDNVGNVKQTLPNGIIGSGINVGALAGSTTEYVNFKAKINCPQPPKPPVYTCNALTVTAGDKRTVKITGFATTATNGAAFKNAVIDWNDKTAPLTTNSVVGQTHQYAADGTYTITATAHFTIDGKGDVTATGPQCQQQVTFAPNTPPKVTPPSTPPATPAAPTALVNTGPGSVVGLFAAVSVAGAFAHRWMLGRRLSRQ